MNKVKELYLKWNWTLMIIFLLLSILFPIFGLLALICMIPAIYISIKKNKKIFCGLYCPRGNFLSKLFSNISMGNDIPKIFKHKTFKFIFFSIMFSLFIYKIIFKTDLTLEQIGFVFFRFILTNTIIGSLMGIFLKPRAWCHICPFGYLTEISAKPQKIYQFKPIIIAITIIIFTFTIIISLQNNKTITDQYDSNYINNKPTLTMNNENSNQSILKKDFIKYKFKKRYRLRCRLKL